MIKVLFDHQTFSIQNFGGVSTYFSYVYSNLKKYDYAKVLLPPMLSSNINLNTVRPTLIGKLWSGPNFKGKIPLQRSFNKFAAKQTLKIANYDVFHPTYYDTYFLPYLGNKPFVITIFDMIHEIYPEMFLSATSSQLVRDQKANISQKATHLIAISEATKKDIVNKLGIAPEKISVVYMAGDNINDVINDPSSVPQALPSRYVLYVGDRRAPYKNFIRFAKSMGPVLKKRPDLFLVTVGGGNHTQEEVAVFQDLGIAKQVVCVPLTNQAPIQRFFYEKAELFVYPSLYEGFGIPLVEAFLCNCPTVASNQSCFPEIAQEASEYFDPLNIDEMTEKIERVLEDQELQKKLCQIGTLRAKEFTWQKAALRSKEIYESLV